MDEIVKVSTAEWDAFLRLLDEAGYWDAASTDLDNAGLDGAQWILEAVKGGQYYLVDRWSPRPEPSPESDLRFRYIGRASGRERVGQEVKNPGGGGTLKKKKKKE